MSERSRDPADPSGDRPPTSHERRAGRPWDASYRDQRPPWDIGRPQAALVRLASAGGFSGEVLDAGCGTGENALHIASLGLSVLGFDVAETAVGIAREKARERGLDAEFVVADVLTLRSPDREFDTVLDCGLFHSFEAEEERRRYAAGLARVTAPGAILHLLCFGDASPDAPAPHPVSQAELRAVFAAASGWKMVAIESDEIEARLDPGAFPAWLARIERV